MSDPAQSLMLSEPRTHGIWNCVHAHIACRLMQRKLAEHMWDPVLYGVTPASLGSTRVHSLLAGVQLPIVVAVKLQLVSIHAANALHVC